MTEHATRNRFLTGARLVAEETDAVAIPLPVREEPPAPAAPAAAAVAAAPGHSLALADFSPPGASLGERIVRLAYRLGVPGPTLAAPFRRPARPRLLATVESPLQGDPVVGTALRAGHFLVHGVKAPITQVDFASSAKLALPFERTVHGFAWLRDLAASAPRAQCTHTAERVLAAWLKANDAPATGAAWRVGNAGQRLLGWLVHAPLILSGTDRGWRGRVLDKIEETARWLDRHVGKADDGLEALAGWSAITAAGLLLPDGKPRRLFGEAGLARTLGELVGSDGGVLSRSPLAQMEAIGLLIELVACYRATRRPPQQVIDTMLQLMVPPLLALVHGDGGLGSWQGAGAVRAERIATLVEASRVRVRPLRDARQWGYQRAAAGQSVLQFDAAPPPLARHARCGCASTLAFELSHGTDRLIVNCGGAAFAGGQVPTRIEQGLRATAAHSTLVLGDANSTAIMVGGKLGRGVGEVEVDRSTLAAESGPATRIEASHDGYVERFGLTHRRILVLRDDGTELRGEDVLEPAGRKGRRGKVPFAIRFHLGPTVDVTASESRRGASLSLPDGSHWQFLCGEETLEIEESLWVDGEGRPHPVQQLVIQGMIPRSGAGFSWLLKKIR